MEQVKGRCLYAGDIKFWCWGLHDYLSEPLLQIINSENKQLVLMADFNIDLRCGTP